MSTELRAGPGSDPAGISAGGCSGLPSSAAEVAPFRLSGWVVLPSLFRVELEGERVQLEPRIMHVLVCLASRAGQVLSRKHLLDTVWNDAVVGEEVLTRAISRLRTTFSDSSSSPRLIETIRGGGYRLMVGVRPLEAGQPELEDEEPTSLQEAVSDGEQQAPEISAMDQVRADDGPVRPVRWRLWLAAVGIIVLVTSALVMLSGPETQGESGPAVPVAIPLTAEPQAESMPRISPDGQMVAYVSGREGTGRSDVWVRQIRGGDAVQLTESPGEDLLPTWSPDGSRVVFARHGMVNASLMEVPALGGVPRLLCLGGSVIEGITWSPDGSTIVLSTREEHGNGLRLFRLDVVSLEMARLTDPPEVFTDSVRGLVGDTDPAYSPDGRLLALTRSDATGLEDVYVMDASGGEPRRLTNGLRDVRGIAWSPDGAELIVSASPRGQHLLWRVAVADGRISWMPSLRSDAIQPSLSQDGQSLVFATRHSDTDIWRFRLFSGEAGEPMEEPVIVSTSMELWPMPSHDGEQVAFVSNRSGLSQIWAANIDGSNLRRLTSFDGVLLERPKWSSDGRRIAFSTIRGSRLAIHVIDVATRQVRGIEPEAPHEQFVEWSGDGEWIYYDVAVGRVRELWRMRLDGSGREPMRLPREDVRFIRYHDRDMYYSTQTRDGVWRWRPGQTGAELVAPAAQESTWLTWAVTEKGIYFVSEGDETRRVRLFDPDTGETRPSAAYFQPSSPLMVFFKDGAHALTTRLERADSDLILIESPLGS